MKLAPDIRRATSRRGKLNVKLIQRYCKQFGHAFQFRETEYMKLLETIDESLQALLLPLLFESEVNPCISKSVDILNLEC